MCGCHNLRMRKMGDMLMVDAHIDIDTDITVEAGHVIVPSAQDAVRARRSVPGMIAHADPWRPV